MKKFLAILGLLLAGLCANADIETDSDYVFLENNVNMSNFWEKCGKSEQKILEVGTKIINANKLEKRVPIHMSKTPKLINASSHPTHKVVTISSGILPYIDNNDELAFVISHEIAHCLDAYKGGFEIVMMRFNARGYEYKADLKGIDLMVNAGYNPIAAISVSNKIMPESPWDFFTTHPVSSKRLFEMYKHIYKNYPWALKTDMIKNVNYQNFHCAEQTKIHFFQQSEKNFNKSQENNL